MRAVTSSHQRSAKGMATAITAGPLRHLVRHAYACAKTGSDSLRRRRLVTTRWVPSEDRWHYSWPEGRVADTGRWRDAQGWATRGTYYGMDDLLFRRYRPKAGDVVFDVGAGDGGETFYLASMVGETRPGDLGRSCAMALGSPPRARPPQRVAAGHRPARSPDVVTGHGHDQ